MNKKLTLGLASLALAGTVGFGAIASAASNGSRDGRGSSVSTSADPSTSTPADPGANANANRTAKHPKLTIEQRCAKAPEMIAKATTRQSKMAERTAALQAKRAEAETAGNTDRVARIDERLARLEANSTRVANRLAKAQTWITANCAG
ncbi:MAG: hypothetical protein WCI22_18095 [Actinomycetota bacterium]